MPSFVGVGGVWAIPAGQFEPKNFPGTAAGIQAAIDFLGSTGGEVYVGPGTYVFGTATLTLLYQSIKIRGAGERATKFTYSGTGDFITIGFNDGNHAGSANAYSGICAFCVLEDLWLVGPGKATTARCIVDWENGNQNYTRLNIDSWGTGYYGIGADVSEWRSCYILKCTKGVFLASRCDQNTFYSCYFAQCDIAANVEYAYNPRFIGCQFVFQDTADIVFDAPASGTDGGDIRVEVGGACDSCWFESSPSLAQIPRHVWFGRNGVSGRVLAGLSVYGRTKVLAGSSKTLNFVDVEAGTNIKVGDVYQDGTLGGKLVNIVSVASVAPIVQVVDCRTSPGGQQLGGTVGAPQGVVDNIRCTNSIAFAASLTIDAMSAEYVQIAALTGNITINAPTNPTRNRLLRFRFLQDGTGGRTVTWNGVFKHAWSDAGNTLNKTSTIAFWYDGANWIQQGAQSPYF